MTIHYPWTRMGAASAGPAPTSMDTIVISWTTSEISRFVGQVNFGTSTAHGVYYTNKATFLAANPGLTLQTFSAAIPGAPLPASTFAPYNGVLSFAEAGALITDSTDMSPVAPFDAVGIAGSSGTLTLLFSTPITAIGFQLGHQSGSVGYTVTFKSGSTTIDSEVLAPPTTDTGVFTTFAGYAI